MRKELLQSPAARQHSQGYACRWTDSDASAGRQTPGLARVRPLESTTTELATPRMPTASEIPGLKRSLLTLVATPNRAAIDVLAAALRSPSAPVRVGAAKALAARTDAESHQRVLRDTGDCPADVRAAIASREACSRLRPVVAAAIQGDDQPLCERACGYAIEAEDYRLLATVVDEAMKPSHPCVAGLCSAALRLARALAAAIEAEEADKPLAARSELTPVRRAANQGLGRALDRFSVHKRLELIDAFLLIANHDNPGVRAVLRDTTHAAHAPLLRALETSAGRGAMELLARAFEDGDAPAPLIEIGARRADLAFCRTLVGRVGPTPGVRVVFNARKTAGFGWATPERIEKLLTLPPDTQAAAVRLQGATRSKSADRLRLIEAVMAGGADAARAAACELLGKVTPGHAQALLQQGLADSNPAVVAATAGRLRKAQMPDALERLVSLLEHDSPDVVSVAQGELREFSFDSYRQVFDKLPKDLRTKAGRLVGLADPEATATLRIDLQSPVVDRRRDALELVGELGVVDRVLPAVTALAGDRDSLIRTRVATLLGGSSQGDAVGYLAEALADPHPGVRQAAEASLTQLDSLDVAQQLLAKLQADTGGVAAGSVTTGAAESPPIEAATPR
ncbi:MAG: HEAT repeat domain-containing protein [Planctomycetota bacterium]